ncbi:MAG: hypothetical protein K2X99_06145 [Gemmatimonadaceae bacterium]|nr:hypothetical protein [Gemmatimonadaceae bacterium]
MVSLALRIRSPEASLALVPSIGVSLAVQRRVARFGEVVTPALLELVARDFERGDALHTLALAMFWADSTGSPLSLRSRGLIQEALTGAVFSPTGEDLPGLRAALRDLRSSSWLEVGEILRARAVALGAAGRPTVFVLDDEVLPPLRSARLPRAPKELLDATLSTFAAFCAVADPGERLGLCKATENQVRAAAGHLVEGRTRAARELLGAVVLRLERARNSGLISDVELALYSGELRAALDLLRGAP